MKNIVFFLPILCLFVGCISTPPTYGTKIGLYDTYNDFKIPQLNRETTVVVHLPNNYKRNTTKRYPVLYMLDGQNIFGDNPKVSHEWCVDENLLSLSKKNNNNEIIVVGIYNSQKRDNEYLPDDYYMYDNKTVVKGEGKQYAAFITETVKPFIDKNYRTLNDSNHTGIIGSSYGAVLSLYIGVMYPESFGLLGLFSLVNMNFVPESDVSLADFITKLKETRKNQKICFVIDVKEMLASGCTIENIQQAYQEYSSSIGYTNTKIVIDPQGEHNEITWGRNFSTAITWLYNWE